MNDFTPVIPVTDVRVVRHFTVELWFEDGTTGVVDLEPFLWGPALQPVRDDYELFSKVRVDHDAGTITWPNGADISPRTLYHEARPERRASL